MVKRSTKIKISLFITLFAGITFAYFTWLTWQKLTEWIGNSNIVWGITGGVVLLFLFFGVFGINKIAKRFS